MKKLLTAITMFAMSAAAMAQSYVIYEWKDSVPTIRNISDIDTITYYLPDDLIRLKTGSPTEVKKTSMISEFELTSRISFADSTITEQGMCYSRTNPNPTIEDDKAKFGPFHKGVCEVTITGLGNNTFYYYRPYFMVADCVYYGPVKTFSTWEGADSSNPSILETLNSIGSFKYYQRLLADSDINSAMMLSKPGTKTLFVANDEAWERFFENNGHLPKSNPWHYAQSYETLSKNQKRLLFHSSMIHQAIPTEQLSSTSGEKPVSGEYLRRYTDVEALDSVTRIAITDLPITYWSADKQATAAGLTQPEEDQWSRIRNGGLMGYDSIYMVQDSSSLMMVHLTKEYMKKQRITDADFQIIMGKERASSDVHIYDTRIESADVVCENGYLNTVSTPLVPLTNMAELIRTNGRTNIYSHLLERFSVPFQNKELGRRYSQLNPNFSVADTLYSKRYYSQRSFGSTGTTDVALSRDERGTQFNDALLRFDPGWNEYYPNGESPETDMGAMFVPNDAQMIEYFNTGGGKTLLEEYTKDHHVGQYNVNDLETLYQDIDQIPLNICSNILNHVMFESFAGAVPSKMLRLRETGSTERIFEECDTRLSKDGGTIDTVLVACNGAVYIMNNVFIPSDFNCVATPAYVGSGNKIMRWAIYSDSEEWPGNTGWMNTNYYAYLKSLQNQMTFFMPNDEAMQYYYDPMSFTSRTPRVMRFYYDQPTGFPFSVGASKTGERVLAQYDVTTGTIGQGLRTQTTNQQEIVNRMRQLLEHNTIVHENGVNAINTEEDEYYLSKNGMGIKVTRGQNGEGVIKAQGGFQLENEREGLAHNHPGILYCNVLEKGDYKNGCTFTIDAPLIPAARSVFSVMSNIKRGQKGEPQEYNNAETIESNPYYEFFRLCNEANWDLITGSGLVDENDPKYDLSTVQGLKALTKAVNRYMTFVDNNAVDYNVLFFDNYNYTVFVPTNEAIREAVANGLPTWESIEEDFNNSLDPVTEELKSAEDSLRIRYKITYLTNFIRTHFADNSVFADKSDMNAEMFTSSFNNETGLFVKTFVQREGGMLKVKDNTASGQWITTKYTTDDGRDVKNIMTCDRECSAKVKDENMVGKETAASSYAVIHLIDGVLNHDELTRGKYPDFTSGNGARKYIQKFVIR